MLLKVFCVLAVTAVSAAVPGHSSQYLIKHEGHHHLVDIHDDDHHHGHHDDDHHHGHHDHQHVDYYMHPKYESKYNVKDPHTGDHKEQHENRDGDSAKGHYLLHEPDGTIRHVHLHADKSKGFHADVKHSTRHLHRLHHLHILHHHHHG